MLRGLTTGLITAGIIALSPIIASQPSRAESIVRSAHRTPHAVHNRGTPCERDPRCSESLSRAAAYGYLKSPHHPSAHRNGR